MSHFNIRMCSDMLCMQLSNCLLSNLRHCKDSKSFMYVYANTLTFMCQRRGHDILECCI